MKLITTLSIFFGNLIYLVSPINNNNLNNFSKYMGCYPGWSYSEAKQNFKEEFKGNIARLESNKNCNGALSDKVDLVFIDSLKNPQSVLDYINIYRDRKGLDKLIYDDETCNIAKRYAISRLDKDNLKYENYKDICADCTHVGANQGVDYFETSSLVLAWETNEATKKNMDDPSYIFGCAKSNNGNVVFIFSNKSSLTKPSALSASLTENKDATNTVSNPSNKTMTTSASPSNGIYIDCLGPDGKMFKTSQAKCDEFNSAWNKKPTVVQSSAQPQNTQKTYPPCTVTYSWGTSQTYDFNVPPDTCKKWQDDAKAGKTNTIQQIIVTSNPTPAVDYSAQNQLNIEQQSQCKATAANYYQQEQAIIRSRKDLGDSSKQNLLNSAKSQAEQTAQECERRYPI